MAQATFSIRMDADLKRQLDELCADFGMSTTTAFNIFAKAVVRERRIPFDISSPQKDDRKKGLEAFHALREEARLNGLQNLTLDDINAEIAEARSAESAAK